ncbi:autotransporter outer membrane beta-barrel domain-containing protein [Mesorhizobium sp. M00.F.Ca.ET.151.01.1.1]|nr:autotransporter outer membrane beta-barrel domain-containing protein [bacterium M00.F.Ca.ET.199.01.1.1]TGS97995.1 autotransporter outer membrane beta-barrel domain-containing protein [bacterium M00.F.Ca.ET.177.01.1.1]TGT59068.1 autotransporter outer membrane beta-barrel domain-containing protein [Mesorhizobium sp. M00.F.Ca.ET.170.01.1.1]TGU11111.1 autotransporter outer membrane beta-barrel domain-containing protein [bacterium M00.F.Ca.ET.163.01.1.1]TGU92751.1 autotransporter outer membrane b
MSCFIHSHRTVSLSLNTLWVGMLVGLAGPAVGGNVSGPGAVATVGPGDPVESWGVQDRATLLVNGGETLQIRVTSGSRLQLNDAKASSQAPGMLARAVAIENGSSATIDRSSITASAGIGLALSRSIMPGALPALPSARLTRSSISGGTSGILFLGADLLIDQGTTVTGASPGAPGLQHGTGQVLVSGQSVVSGAGNGVRISDTTSEPDDMGRRLFVDGATVTGQSGSGILVDHLTNQSPTTAEITLSNGAVVNGGNGIAIETAANAQTGNHDEATVNVLASTIRGDMVSRGGRFDIALAEGAVVEGRFLGLNDARVGGGSTWLMAGSSDVASLALEQDGHISLGNGAGYNTLSISGDYVGSGGTLEFHAALGDDTSATDRLRVLGSTSGQTFVAVKNAGGAGAKTSTGIEIVTVGGESSGQFDLQGRAIGGQYEYFLVKDGKNWYLRSQSTSPADPCIADPSLPECDDTVPPVDPEDPVVPILRPEPGAYLANLAAAQDMFKLGYHDRHAGQNSGRAWARVDGSRSGFSALSRQLIVTGNSQAITVGADLWRSDNGSNAGVMLSSGNATSTSKSDLTQYYARGKVKGEALGVYGTLRYGNASDPYAGLYLDGSVQRAQFRNRVQGLALDAERYDTRAWQGAIEAGYAFRLSKDDKSNVYLEPELQVGYSRWDNYRHSESNGTDVAAHNAGGLFGRIGLRLSGATRWSNGAAQVQPFLTLNWLHNRSEAQISMDGEAVDARIPRTRAEVSAGASIAFSSRWGFWGSLSRQGASGYHQTSARVGLSYAW